MLLPRRSSGPTTLTPVDHWFCNVSYSARPMPRQTCSIQAQRWFSVNSSPPDLYSPRQPTIHCPSLPISPLADESFLSARTRWTNPKPPKSPYKLTKFQRKLVVNPYAQILASPTRCCPLTKAHLPRECLQSFKLVAHPESGEPWWLPPDLVDGLDGVLSIPSSTPVGVARGPSVYTLPRRDFLHGFVEPSGKYRKAYRSFLRMSTSPDSAGFLSKAAWRADMDSYVLELMQRRVYSDLVYFSNLTEFQGRRYLLSSEDFDRSTIIHQLGCVLDVCDPTPHDIDHDTRKFCLSKFGLAESTHVPVFNMCHLLGKDRVARLRAQSRIFETSRAVVVRGFRTAGLHKKIWKLSACNKTNT